MTSEDEQSKLAAKLMEPVARIVSRHAAQLAPMLNNGAAATQSALNNDEAVRTVATYCYALLPGLVRIAVKEPAFISFVLANRVKLLGKLAAGETAAAQ
ncbi:hypothetical protein ACFSQU_12375 [Massilia sp. GCM10020059]|uniref:Uncharacterized protein n=1 Tax=Massilia agrisoli TaxID=2892444 RepID=A0ABS8IQT3_9BURK|nr:hypothetical protein [Massilia agrisoli]MCC6070197.1 hypothetical protein [Massilia agrisoli]